MQNNKVLFVKGEGGLGNRILCLLTAILYARLSKRALIIDWSDHYFSTDKSNSFDRYFCYKGRDRIMHTPATNSVAPAIWRNYLQNSVSEMYAKFVPRSYRHPETWSKLSIDLSRLDHPEDVLVMWTYFEQIDVLRKHLYGEFDKYQGKGTKTILKNLLSENLSLKEAIRSQVAAFTKGWPGKNTIGIHVRYSDRKSRLPPMLKKLDSLTRNFPEAQIFLATDSIEIKDKLERKYHHVLTTPKQYPQSGQPMHRRFPGSDPARSGQEALVDMYVLAAADYLILDESSSFAYLVSLLSQAPEHCVFNFQRARWIPAPLKHKLWIQMQKLKWRNWRLSGSEQRGLD